MRYRPHRGGLAESVAETIELTGRAALVEHLQQDLAELGRIISDQDVSAKPYGGDDDRIGWKDVHIVTIEGWGVAGFCEGPIDPPGVSLSR